MARNLAIVVGINDYQDKSLKALSYAQRDAALIDEFLREQAKFAEVCLFSSSLPDFQGYSTRPSRYALRKFLRERFNQPFLKPADHFWFFFSGHGIRHQNRDYLIPEDGDPDDPEETAIPLHWVTERLSRSGSENIVLILDACRQAGREGQRGDEQFGDDVQKGIVTLYACKPDESSWEIDQPICQGSFTHTLLQSFQSQTAQSCLTIEQMEQHLQQKVPELNRQYGKPWQTPHIQIDSVSQSKQILLPYYAAQANIAQLKTAALEAELEADFDLADKLWTQVLMTSEVDRPKALAAIKRIALKKANLLSASVSVNQSAGQRSATPSPAPEPILSPESPLPTPKSDDLSSERFGDNYYAKLRDLLKAGKWQEADQETNDRMCEVMDRQQAGWLQEEDIEKFPRQDLRSIDRLWLKYSDGKFGFNVQKKIWQECGSPTIYNKDWNKFCDQVGWRVKGSYISYLQVKFNTSAPLGHLPVFFVSVAVNGGGCWLGALLSCEDL